MHELLLHASVPTSRHTQLLSILSGIAAMQPLPFHEQHMIYKPIRPATKPVTQVGGSQAVQSNPMQAVQGAMQGDLFYLHLVEDLVGKEGGREMEVKEKTDGDVEMDVGDVGREMGGVIEVRVSFPQNYYINLPSIYISLTYCTSPPLNASSQPRNLAPPSIFHLHDLHFLLLLPHHLTSSQNPPQTSKPPNPSKKPLILQFRDIPEPGSRRPVTSRLAADIPLTTDDAPAFMSALDYIHTSTHHLHGHSLTHASTRILLFQPTFPPSSSSSPAKKTIVPLDPSNHILQLSLLVSDGTKPELMARGVKELMALKERLRGCVELEAVERGGLDMR
ncbi:MAG: hypothetical protein Q9170_008389, partial [Blastenia crenularia]